MQRPLDLIQVGVITSAHGVRGQVKIRSLFDQSPKEFLTYGTVTDAKGTIFKLNACGGTEHNIITTIEGLTDRNAAELLKGTALFARKESIPPTRIAPIMYENFEVRLQNGETYGKVVAAYNFGAGDIIEIYKTNGGTEMLPAREPFLRKAVMDENYLVIDPPEYIDSGE